MIQVDCDKLCICIVIARITKIAIQSDTLKNTTDKSKQKCSSQILFSYPTERQNKGTGKLNINKNKMTDLSLNVSVVTLNENGLNTAMKRQRVSE